MAGRPRTETVLDHHPSSAGVARRFLRETLRRWSVDHTAADNAVLVVDELVTNALLHSSSEVGVVAELLAETLRIEVTDDSPEPPAVRAYGRDAITGRGLELVGILTAGWGVEVRGAGKVVWAEIRLTPNSGAPPSVTDGTRDPIRPDDGDDGELHTVRLLEVPIALFLGVQRHHDALLREFALVAIHLESAPERDDTPQRLRDLVTAARGGFARPRDVFRRQIETAVRAGHQVVDLEAEVPYDSVAALQRYIELLEEAEAYIERGDLLTPPPSPEVLHFRRWLLDASRKQIVEGRPPDAFSWA